MVACATSPGDSLLTDAFGDYEVPFEKSYVLGGEINEGCYGVVYKTHHVSSREDTFAVKIIERDCEDAAKEAQNEAEILRQLMNIPNVVQLIDYFMDKDQIYIVQAFAEGGDVFDRLAQRQNYTENDARDLARTLLSTVDSIHKHKIVHRDLKPENLLLKDYSNDSGVVLCDFGLAKRLPDDENSGLLTFCGTPSYSAPEIIEFKEYREKVDMWSIGCILYMLLGGNFPFGTCDDMDVYERICIADYDFVDEAWSCVTGSAKSTVDNLLQLDPNKRWSAAEVLDSAWFKREQSQLKKKHLLKTHLGIKKVSTRRKIETACRDRKVSNCAPRVSSSAGDQISRCRDLSISPVPACLPENETSKLEENPLHEDDSISCHSENDAFPPNETGSTINEVYEEFDIGLDIDGDDPVNTHFEDRGGVCSVDFSNDENNSMSDSPGPMNSRINSRRNEGFVRHRSDSISLEDLISLKDNTKTNKYEAEVESFEPVQTFSKMPLVNNKKHSLAQIFEESSTCSSNKKPIKNIPYHVSQENSSVELSAPKLNGVKDKKLQISPNNKTSKHQSFAEESESYSISEVSTKNKKIISKINSSINIDQKNTSIASNCRESFKRSNYTKLDSVPIVSYMKEVPSSAGKSELTTSFMKNPPPSSNYSCNGVLSAPWNKNNANCVEEKNRHGDYKKCALIASISIDDPKPTDVDQKRVFVQAGVTGLSNPTILDDGRKSIGSRLKKVSSCIEMNRKVPVASFIRKLPSSIDVSDKGVSVASQNMQAAKYDNLSDQKNLALNGLSVTDISKSINNHEKRESKKTGVIKTSKLNAVDEIRLSTRFCMKKVSSSIGINKNASTISYVRKVSSSTEISSKRGTHTADASNYVYSSQKRVSIQPNSMKALKPTIDGKERSIGSFIKKNSSSLDMSVKMSATSCRSTVPSSTDFNDNKVSFATKYLQRTTHDQSMDKNGTLTRSCVTDVQKPIDVYLKRVSIQSDSTKKSTPNNIDKKRASIFSCMKKESSSTGVNANVSVATCTSNVSSSTDVGGNQPLITNNDTQAPTHNKFVDKKRSLVWSCAKDDSKPINKNYNRFSIRSGLDTPVPTVNNGRVVTIKSCMKKSQSCIDMNHVEPSMKKVTSSCDVSRKKVSDAVQNISSQTQNKMILGALHAVDRSDFLKATGERGASTRSSTKKPLSSNKVSKMTIIAPGTTKPNYLIDNNKEGLDNSTLFLHALNHTDEYNGRPCIRSIARGGRMPYNAKTSNITGFDEVSQSNNTKAELYYPLESTSIKTIASRRSSIGADSSKATESCNIFPRRSSVGTTTWNGSETNLYASHVKFPPELVLPKCHNNIKKVLSTASLSEKKPTEKNIELKAAIPLKTITSRRSSIGAAPSEATKSCNIFSRRSSLGTTTWNASKTNSYVLHMKSSPESAVPKFHDSTASLSEKKSIENGYELNATSAFKAITSRRSSIGAAPSEATKSCNNFARRSSMDATPWNASKTNSYALHMKSSSGKHMPIESSLSKKSSSKAKYDLDENEYGMDITETTMDLSEYCSDGMGLFDEVYSLEQIRNQSVPELDYMNSEKYLSNQDFKEVFGESRSEVSTWKKWRVNEKKKKAGIF